MKEQQNTHKEFSDKIKELQGQLTDRNNTVAAELSTYLNFWLIDHIVISDSQYATLPA
jgi:hemerythrin